RRRAAIEPVIGHLKQDHRMGRNYLTGRDGDRINAVLAAAGYNFSLLLRWFEELLRVLSLILCHALLAAPLHLTGAAKLSSRPTSDICWSGVATIRASNVWRRRISSFSFAIFSFRRVVLVACASDRSCRSAASSWCR